MDLPADVRVLIVEDEDAIRRLTSRTLTDQGFACDVAADGVEAEERIARQKYDVVVTDLRMPNKHGHALALALLSLPERPIIVIHTGVTEPRLARDLLARGVDDILFKPLDFGILAAKVRALVDRRRRERLTNEAVASATPPSCETETDGDRPIDLEQLLSKLSGLSRILPISDAAFDVYGLTTDDRTDALQIAAAIQRDAAFAAEVLRLANSLFYNPSAQPITELERAVVRIGRKRIGDLALATHTLTTLTANVLPWLDIGLVWRRSMAAGLAVEMLVEETKSQRLEEGLVLGAIVAPLGRVVLGMLFPEQYETLTERCRAEGGMLAEREAETFPLDPIETMARLLEIWKVPEGLRLPLQRTALDAAALERLPTEQRRQAELLRAAIDLGEAAVGRWETWDKIDVPSATLARLGVADPTKLIERIRRDVDVLADFRFRGTKPSVVPAVRTGRELDYEGLTAGSADHLERVIASMGIVCRPLAAFGGNHAGGIVVVNGLGKTAERAAENLTRLRHRKLLIVTDEARAESFRRQGQVITLPTSYDRLRQACWTCSRPTPEQAGSARSSLSVFA